MDGFTFGSDWINYRIISSASEVDTLNEAYDDIKNYYKNKKPFEPFACVTQSQNSGPYMEDAYVASTYKGYPVRVLEKGAFVGSANKPLQVGTLHLPSSIECLCHKAFDGVQIQKIHFYGPLKYARKISFNACRKTEEIIIPYIHTLESTPLFDQLDNLDNLNVRTKIFCEIGSKEDSLNCYLSDGSACIEYSGTPRSCACYANQNPTRNYLKTLRVVGSDRLTVRYNEGIGNGNTVNSLPTLETLIFSPQCKRIESLPLFTAMTKDEQLNIKEIYINNIIEKIPDDQIYKQDGLGEEGVNWNLSFFHPNISNEKIQSIKVYVPWLKEDYEDAGNLLENLCKGSKGGTCQIIYGYQPEDWDTDFIGVSFKGKHLLRDYNIYRVSSSNRYDMHLNSNQKLNTATEKTFEGTYYFNSTRQPLQFNLNLAYDSLTAKQLEEVRQLFSPNEIGPLVFDEYPYKVYDAKVVGQPKMDFVLFGEDNEERIYKGTMTIQLTAYFPFAHTPIDKKYGVDGKYLLYYDNFPWSQKSQWREVSGLIDLDETFVLGVNRGEAPAPYIVTLTGSVKANDTVTIAGNTITFKEDCSNVEWNSKTGLVIGDVGGTRRAVRFTGQSIHRLPVGNSNTITYNLTGGATFAIDYQFWYY